MDTSVCFEQTSEQISKLLQAASHDIVVAIAWFTDQSLFNVLRRKASEGISVNLLYLDDNINNRASFNIQQLKAYDAQIYPVLSDARPDDIMHNKFCVIDGKNVIAGSYNWTNRAEYNDENVTVFIDNPEIASHFLKQFDDLLEKYNFRRSTKLCPQSIIPRLEIIKNFSLMNEWDSLPPQLDKLRSFVDTWNLSPLFTAVESRDNQVISEWVEEFIKSNTTLVVHEDEDVAELKIELRLFEFKVVTLSAEKDELEKMLSDFHQKTNLILGELTARFLKLQAQRKQKKAEKLDQDHPDKDTNEEEANESWHEYEEYQKGFDELKNVETPAEISDEDRRELKATFKKASFLCHPDKVDGSQREAAKFRFIKLKKAYDQNDLGLVKSIYNDLINNRPFEDSADTISDSGHLKREINRLQNTYETLLMEVISLRNQISSLGINVIEDLDEYFRTQKRSLESAVEDLEAELSNVE